MAEHVVAAFVNDELEYAVAVKLVAADPVVAAVQFAVNALTCDVTEVIVGALGVGDSAAKLETTRFPVP